MISMTSKKYVKSELGIDSGHTVKYSVLPLGVPSGKVLYLRVNPSSRSHTDIAYHST